MKSHKFRLGALFAGLVAVMLAMPLLPSPVAEARSNGNWTSVEHSRYCSQRAERYADRYVRRMTTTGALTGAAVGSVSRNRRSSAGRGALIGGSIGMLHANSYWRSAYHRYYARCARR